MRKISEYEIIAVLPKNTAAFSVLVLNEPETFRLYNGLVTSTDTYRVECCFVRHPVTLHLTSHSHLHREAVHFFVLFVPNHITFLVFSLA
jgi:hypothetical protein